MAVGKVLALQTRGPESHAESHVKKPDVGQLDACVGKGICSAGLTT